MVASKPRIPVSSPPVVTWEPLPLDFVLPDDPVENIQQPSLAAALTDALGANQCLKPDMLIGSNFGLVATLDQKSIVKAPDWFYVTRANPLPEGNIRRSYTPYAEGEPVSVVMEFLSDGDYGELSVRSSPPYGKLYFYEQILQVPTYVTYDPYKLALEVRQLVSGEYQLRPPDSEGRFWIPELGLHLGLWYGVRLGTTIQWLRWWDKAGNLLLWSAEQADAERHRAEVLAAKLRELGVDPDV